MVYKIKSNTVGNLEYNVEETDGRWSCDCPAGQAGKKCILIKKAQHIKEYGAEMAVNENLIEIVRGKKGLAPIAEPLLVGEEVKVVVHGDIVSVEEEDNNDGTINRIHKVKAKIVEKL